MTTKFMSEKQYTLITNVIAELALMDALTASEAQDLIKRTDHLYDTDGATVDQASIFIDKLLAAKRAARASKPKPPAAPAVPKSKMELTEDGMYRDPSTKRIYKVQKSVITGRLYAKELVVNADGEVHFDYSPGAVYSLKPEWKMTLAEAKEFGALYGSCCVCGRTLTNAVSIEAGIGPICARSFSA